MNEQRILTDVDEGVATITLNRPEAMNAFEDGMRETLLERLETYGTDNTVRCIVITGAGKAFCAGGDIVSMAALQDNNDTTVVEERMTLAARVIQTIKALRQPVIAAINGAAAGGGMNLALACDIRLASERAIFAESFVKIGLIPDWGGFSLLPQLVGTAKAMELMMLGDRIDAAEAQRLGLLNHVYPRDAFNDEVAAFARRLAAGPPETLARIKEGFYLGARESLADGLAYEYRAQRKLFLSDNAREGMRAFIEKRDPTFGNGD
jgi:2-(1,2-epoxy-1,2-dihydrophenyl)acetyl-CoA isomerase